MITDRRHPLFLKHKIFRYHLHLGISSFICDHCHGEQGETLQLYRSFGLPVYALGPRGRIRREIERLYPVSKQVSPSLRKRDNFQRLYRKLFKRYAISTTYSFFLRRRLRRRTDSNYRSTEIDDSLKSLNQTVALGADRSNGKFE